jgi:hypothetical protein
MARAGEDQWCLHGFCESLCLQTDLLLLFSWEVDEVVVLCANEEGNGSLVEASSLPVPLFDAVEGRLSCQVEHEENGNGVIADQGKHVDELPLATQIPDGEGDFGVADANCLLHEVHA